MTEQYNQNNINLEGVSAVTSFIFDSTSTEPSDIVYNDWDALLGAAQATPGLKEIIIPEGNPPPITVTIPPGTYDMTNIALVGTSPVSSALISDVVFQNLTTIKNLTLSTPGNTVPSFVFNDGSNHVLTVENSSLLTAPTSTAPMIDVSNGSILAIPACTSAFLSSNPGVPLITVGVGATIQAASFAGSQGNNWGGGFGVPAFVTVAPGGMFFLGLATGDIFWSTNNPAGPTLVSRSNDYEEAVLADWSGLNPLNVKTALDRIAAHVGPVP